MATPEKPENKHEEFDRKVERFDLDDRTLKIWEIIRMTPIVIIALILMFVAVNKDMHKPVETEIPSDGNLYVHYIDVGQGDSTFIQLPNGQVLLIDAGEKDQGEKVVNYIKQFGYTHLDYVVATHPHSDHIGGLPAVLDNFTVGKFYMPKLAEESIPTTQTYLNLLEKLDEKNIEVNTARAGIYMLQEWNTVAEFIGPREEYYDDLNNYSARILLRHGGRSFMFLGDSEREGESEILEDVMIEVLKLSHHGSNTSSSDKFLRRVRPDIAIISCGADNEYGHPHEEVLQRVEDRDAQLYRTDLDGTIIIKTDGVNLDVTTEK